MTKPALVILFLAAACGGASTSRQDPRLSTTSPVAPGPAPQAAAPTAALTQPAALSQDDVARVLAQASAGVDATSIPDGGKEPLTIVGPTPADHTYVPFSRFDRLLFNSEGPEQRGETGTPVQVHQRLMVREPVASLSADGTVTVEVETIRPLPGASVYYGARLPKSVLRRPRYRKRSVKLEPATAGASHHRYQLKFNVGSLIKPKYDAASVITTGRGEVAWRVELLDALEGTSRLHDGVLAFRCEATPCSRRGPFVALPTVNLGPFVDRIDRSSAVISFETDVPTAGRVYVTDGAGFSAWFDSDAPGRRHEVRLSGLRAGTRYRYYAAVVDRSGETSLAPTATFATESAQPGDGFSFVVLSDSRSGQGAGEQRYAGTNRAILGALLEGAVRRAPAMAVFVGDLIDGYTTEQGSYVHQLRAWMKTVQPVGAYVPIYEVMGNHESLLDAWSPGWAVGKRGADSAEALFAAAVVNPDNGPKAEGDAPPYRENVYSWDLGNAHFSAINSNYYLRSHPDREDHPARGRGSREGWVDDTTMAWLEADLADARKRGQKHLFVFTHEPAFPNGGHVWDGMYWQGKVPEVLERRKALCDILVRHGVLAMFHGDEHNYSRMTIDSAVLPGLDGAFTQVITGGAGAPYYAREETPWVGEIDAFDLRQHFVHVRVDGDRVTLEAVAVTGETIDRTPLTR